MFSQRKSGPIYLGPIAHPAVGVRIPGILLTGILRAYKRRNVAGGLELSFGRETAPDFVIEAPPGVYPIVMGHTGTSIKKYMTMSAEAAREHCVIIEIEADHLIIGSLLRAIKRIAGVKEIGRISQVELKKSLEYNKAEIDEAISTNVVNAFTTDTSDLINYEVRTLTDEEAKTKFSNLFSNKERNKLYRTFLSREFVFEGIHYSNYRYRINEFQLMRLALKFRDSIRVNLQIYNYIKRKMNRPFGFEISLDETPEMTRDEEILFYLSEWQTFGAHADFIAPNIGFKKRMDFHGNLKELETRIAKQAAIARSFGALLSIHSGSGTTPYSGKGRGTYRALVNATGGDLKYKISGVYIELLFEIMASFRPHSKERKLYNKIFDVVYNYLRDELESDGFLASKSLRTQMEKYDEEVAGGIRERRSPRAAFFRFNSFLALNLRDAEGTRYLRDALVALYRDDTEFRKQVDREVEKLTIRLLDGLNFGNNIEKLM